MGQRYLGGAFPLPWGEDGSVDRQFLDLSREHRLAVQRCQDCGRSQFPPEVICRICQSHRVEWTDIEPVGTVYSWSRVWHPSNPAVKDKLPYLVVVVDVSLRGARFVGNILGDPMQDVSIGDRVRAVFEDSPEDDVTLIQWTVERG